MKKNICILIVTFNRKKNLEKLLNSLICLKEQISGIFIFDNNSTDGTADMLKEMNIIDYIVKNEVIMKKNNSDRHKKISGSETDPDIIGF